jgi:hypothetical protein
MSIQRDQQARSDLIESWNRVFGALPELQVLQMTQAVAFLESGGMYASAKFPNLQTGESVSITNIGAVQCTQTPPCPSSCLEATDTHGAEWQAAHPGIDPHYQACFKNLASSGDAWDTFLNTLYKQHGRSQTVLPAAQSGDIDAMAAAMRGSGYFEDSVAHYAQGLDQDARSIAASLGEPLVVTRGGGIAPSPPAPFPPSGEPSPWLLALAFGTASYVGWELTKRIRARASSGVLPKRAYKRRVSKRPWA